jgi:NAD(P)H-hydrate epimerase
MSALPSYPILTCEAARALEHERFGSDESKEWSAMQQAGRAIAAAVWQDCEEMGGFRPRARVLVLVGKGHNGGDALIAAQVLGQRLPAARVDVLFLFGQRALRPLAARAWREGLSARATVLRGLPDVGTKAAPGTGYDLCLDGVFGFQFRPPATPAVVTLLERVNALPIRLRAAVDLPSAGVFQADFTYATGSVKDVVLATAAKAGRVRFLDLGFFRGDEPGSERVLTRDVLAPLRGLRSPQSDKRTYGHLFVLGGSRSFPGAVLMAVLAALRSGAGLVTAFVPESIAGAFAARAPEAMWVGWPETPTGELALGGHHLLRERLARADALVVGPGLGRAGETRELVKSIVRESKLPLVIDADALQADVVRAGDAPRILTPHAGELARIDGGADGAGFLSRDHVTTVLKGPVTTVQHRGTAYRSFFGGPVLARGGSGDLLAGLIGGLLAQTPGEPLLAAARGVVWHGLAADELARAHGQTAVQITQLLDFLPAALRECENDQ